VTLKLAETLVVKSRLSVPYGDNLFKNWILTDQILTQQWSQLGAIHKRYPQKICNFLHPTSPLSAYVHIWCYPIPAALRLVGWLEFNGAFNTM